jgi:type I restriction enzyme M protein
LRPKNKNIKPEYFASFLKSRFGQDQIQRFTRGAVQMGLILEDMTQLVIPDFSPKFEDTISEIVLVAQQCLKQSELKYQQAEDLLLSELGLEDWQPTEETVAVKSFAESFLSSGRLDAEYYQPKYDDLLKKLKALQPKRIIHLELLLSMITNGHTPRYHDLSIGEIKFLTAEHVGDFRINYATEKRILEVHHETELSRTRLFNNDILVTIKGKIGNAVIIEELSEEVNINQDVALIRLEKGVNPWYIVGFLNSMIGKTLVDQICTGQINPFLSLGNLKQIPIPIFDNSYMDKLGNQIKLKIHAARKDESKSKQLLEIAKTGVERAIETDEETTIEWINQQLEHLNINLIKERTK